MTNRNYVNGTNFEYKVKKELENDGYTVFRTAGSHGKADLIALHRDEGTWLIQCKRNGIISHQERQELKELGLELQVKTSLAYREKVGRKYEVRYTHVVD